MAKKHESVKAIVHVRQSWVDTTGVTVIFKSANIALGPGDTLGIPVTDLDISDNYSVEFTFYPRVLEKARVRSLKVFVPKEAVVLILDIKEMQDQTALGYGANTDKVSDVPHA